MKPGVAVDEVAQAGGADRTGAGPGDHDLDVTGPGEPGELDRSTAQRVLVGDGADEGALVVEQQQVEVGRDLGRGQHRPDIDREVAGGALEPAHRDLVGTCLPQGGDEHLGRCAGVDLAQDGAVGCGDGEDQVRRAGRDAVGAELHLLADLARRGVEGEARRRLRLGDLTGRAEVRVAEGRPVEVERVVPLQVEHGAALTDVHVLGHVGARTEVHVLQPAVVERGVDVGEVEVGALEALLGRRDEVDPRAPGLVLARRCRPR